MNLDIIAHACHGLRFYGVGVKKQIPKKLLQKLMVLSGILLNMWKHNVAI